MEFIKSNFWEIKNSFSLKVLGLALSISHFIIILNWWQLSALIRGSSLNCWSFMHNCQEHIFANPSNGKLALFFYGFLILISTLSFAFNKLTHLAIISLFFANLLNLIFLIYDSNLNSDVNTLIFFLTLFYIFIPQKLRVTKVVFIMSYFIWGALKVNNEWLAGYWLSKNLMISLPPKGIEWVAAITIFAEMISPLFILSKQSHRFFIGIGLLLFYSAIKGSVQGWEYSVINLMLIVYFVISRHEEEKEARESLYRSYLRPEPSKAWVAFAFVILLVTQSIPLKVSNKITLSEGPLFYERSPIPIECKYHTFIKYENELHHYNAGPVENENDKLKCKSISYFNHAQSLCDEFKNQPKFKGVSAYFLRRVISQKEFTRVFETDNICNKKPKDFEGVL